MARCCTVVSAATACVCDIAMGPYQGKETGETALLREILDAFDEGDVAVLDRLYGSYMMLAMLQLRGIHACTRLHHGRINDPELVRRLGKNDDLIVWNRPVRPEWMSEALYKQIPEELLLRQVRCDLTGTNCRTEQVTVITTLTDSEAYTADDIAKLYSLRWNVELDIREIKRTLGLDHMRCKSPHMVRRELRVTLLAYNLIRKVIATAAAVHDKQPRRLSFTLACQNVLSSWMLLATGAVLDTRRHWVSVLKLIAEQEIPHRPGRIEPRSLKRRTDCYPYMTKPRKELREALGKRKWRPGETLHAAVPFGWGTDARIVGAPSRRFNSWWGTDVV